MQDVVGALVLHFDGNTIYTPERVAGGNAGVFVVNVTQVNDAPKLTVTIEARRPKDTTFTNINTFPSDIETTGTYVQNVASGHFSAHWLWRLAFSFAAGANPTDAVRLTYHMIPRLYY